MSKNTKTASEENSPSPDENLLQQQAEAEQQRLETERLERERLENERQQQAQVESKRLEQQRLEQERLESERLEQQKLEEEKLERERLEQSKPKRVRVIYEGTLGHLLLKKGDTTEDADYVELLKTTRGKTLVQEV